MFFIRVLFKTQGLFNYTNDFRILREPIVTTVMMQFPTTTKHEQVNKTLVPVYSSSYHSFPVQENNLHKKSLYIHGGLSLQLIEHPLVS